MTVGLATPLSKQVSCIKMDMSVEGEPPQFIQGDVKDGATYGEG
jgi:hypothetical protein